MARTRLYGDGTLVEEDFPVRDIRHPVGFTDWTSDWQLYLPSAAFLYDLVGFSVRWLRAPAADQWPGSSGTHGPYGSHVTWSGAHEQ
ncbi:hypothetical protein ACWY4P_47750 [Streptomyces sp. LZ34]